LVGRFPDLILDQLREPGGRLTDVPVGITGFTQVKRALNHHPVAIPPLS